MILFVLYIRSLNVFRSAEYNKNKLDLRRVTCKPFIERGFNSPHLHNIKKHSIDAKVSKVKSLFIDISLV